MKQICVVLLLIAQMGCAGQQETFDIISYTPPAGWNKLTKPGLVSYSVTNKQKGTWCQVALVQSSASLGDIDKDFEDDWQQLIVKSYNVTETPQLQEVKEEDGWKIKPGLAKCNINNSPTAVLLTTITGYGKRTAVVTLTNTDTYLPEVDKMMASLDLKKPADNNVANNTVDNANTNTVTTTTAAKKDGFAFNSTNFDDGWVSTVQEDWVEVGKGNVKVLLHYPLPYKDGKAQLVATNQAWDALVAPRYAGLKNFKTTYINGYRMVNMAMGYAVENASGQEKFIVLFRRTGGWLEVVSPDKNTFIQYFGFDPETVRWDSNLDLVNKLDAIKDKNRFAVSAADLSNTGGWTDRFSSNSFWASYATGAYMGMSTYTSSEKFVFSSGQSYSWDLIAANSYGGVTKMASAKGSGSFKSLSNWQLFFSDIEGKAKTFDVYFVAVKGGRILFMNDAKYPGSGVFKGFSRQ
ncbi:MAG: hypothetical protein QM726_25345 [Chitinophagaceae bacterium]